MQCMVKMRAYISNAKKREKELDKGSISRARKDQTKRLTKRKREEGLQRKAPRRK